MTHSADVINMNLSDHKKAVYVTLNVPVHSVDSIQTNNVKFLSTAGLSLLNRNLALVDWSFIANNSSLDEKWSVLIKTIAEHLEAVVTSKIRRKGN